MQDETQAQQAYQPPMPRYTWRLTYAYKDDEVRPIRAEHVQMIAPPPVGPAPREGQSGNWLEVRGERDELLYHRILPTLIRQDREVFTNEPGHSIHRVPLKVIEGEFQVLVPDIAGAAHLLLRGHGPGRKEQEAAQVLARNAFKELANLPRTR